MMNDLEQLVRNALADGSMSTGDMADTLANILNKIEQEKKTEVDKAQELKKNALESLTREFAKNYANHPHHLSARDAAIVALMSVSDMPENKDWTAEDVANFMKNMTENIETTTRLWEGHTDSEEDRLNQAMRVAGDKFNALIDGMFEKGAFDKLLKPLGQLVGGDVMSSSIPEPKVEKKPAHRFEVDKLRKWLEEQGW